jgi:hypothetical protein
MTSRLGIHLTLLIFEKSKFFLETSLEPGEDFDEKKPKRKILWHVPLIQNLLNFKKVVINIVHKSGLLLVRNINYYKNNPTIEIMNLFIKKTTLIHYIAKIRKFEFHRS